jgi:hypothetical protein
MDPVHKMVLECTFNELMQDVGCDQLANIGVRKIVSEWLQINCGENKKELIEMRRRTTRSATTPNSSHSSKYVPTSMSSSVYS